MKIHILPSILHQLCSLGERACKSSGIVNRLFFFVLLPFFLQNLFTTCDADVSQQTASNFSTHKSLWDSLKIQQYEFTYQRKCSCEEGATKLMNVEVRHDIVTFVSYVENEEAVPEKYAKHIPTMNELFKEISKYVDQDVQSLKVEYDANYGYPKLIVVDKMEMMHDELIVTVGLGFTSSGVVADYSITTTGKPTSTKTTTVGFIPSNMGLEELEAAQDLWDSQGYSNYDYVYERAGKPRNHVIRPMLVQVRDRRVTSIEYYNSDSAKTKKVPNKLKRNIPTIEGLFDMLAYYADEGVVSWKVKHDSVLGYPSDIDIDISGAKRKEKILITIRNVERVASQDQTTTTTIGPDTTSDTSTTDTLMSTTTTHNSLRINTFPPEAVFDLESNRTAWESLNISNYNFTFRMICFCIQDSTRPLHVNVVDGNITGVLYMEDSQPVDERFVKNVRTVDGLFDMIQAYMDDANVYMLDVTYDDTMGYPRKISMNGRPMIVDDEVDYLVQNLIVVEEEKDSNGAENAPTANQNQANVTARVSSLHSTNTTSENLPSLSTPPLPIHPVSQLPTTTPVVFVTKTGANITPMVVVTETTGYCPTLHADFLRRMSEVWLFDAPFTATDSGNNLSFNETNYSAGEEHTPYTVVETTEDRDSATATITVGVEGNYHPMIASEDIDVIHWVSHVYAVDQNGAIVTMIALDPVALAPAVVMFDVPEGVTSLTAFAFCNRHGLYQGPTVVVPETSTEITRESCSVTNPGEVAWPYIHADFLRRQRDEHELDGPYGVTEEDKEDEEYFTHAPHIMTVEKEKNLALVQVGGPQNQTFHPMASLEDENPPHFITEMYVVDESGVIVTMQSLDPTEVHEATIVFRIPPNAHELTPYAYCNQEGLYVGPTYVIGETDEDGGDENVYFHTKAEEYGGSVDIPADIKVYSEDDGDSVHIASTLSRATSYAESGNVPSCLSSVVLTIILSMATMV